MWRASPAHPQNRDINVLNRGVLEKCRKCASSPQVQEQSTPLTLSKALSRGGDLVCVWAEKEGGLISSRLAACNLQGNPWKHSMSSPPPPQAPLCHLSFTNRLPTRWLCDYKCDASITKTCSFNQKHTRNLWTTYLHLTFTFFSVTYIGIT